MATHQVKLKRPRRQNSQNCQNSKDGEDGTSHWKKTNSNVATTEHETSASEAAISATETETDTEDEYTDTVAGSDPEVESDLESVHNEVLRRRHEALRNELINMTVNNVTVITAIKVHSPFSCTAKEAMQH